MASLDPVDRNREFAESVGANFVILSDPKAEAARAYGVLADGGKYTRRWTFYIDPDGIIRGVDRDVSPAGHGAEIARRLAELGFPLRPGP